MLPPQPRVPCSSTGSAADIQPSTGRRILQLVRDPAHLPHGIVDDAVPLDAGDKADRNAQVEPTARTLLHLRAVEPRLQAGAPVPRGDGTCTTTA